MPNLVHEKSYVKMHFFNLEIFQIKNKVLYLHQKR